jgi:predicted MFS family arabinose efflux permease
MTAADMPLEKKHSLRALDATNFFLADVQTGLGPFLAAYLAGAGWAPGRVGLLLTAGGILGLLLQTPAGAIVDRVRSKRSLLVVASFLLAIGALLLSLTTQPWAVYTSQLLIGGAGAFLGTTLAAVTMGLVGAKLFDLQFGKNQSFNSAGNVVSALLIASVSKLFGNQAIFITAAALTIPTIFSVLSIRRSDIDSELARGGCKPMNKSKELEAASITRTLLGDRVLLTFIVCAFFFHFANAAMLPQLGEMLTKGAKETAAPFMSACIVVTQIVIMCSAPTIGRYTRAHGRKPLLLLGFGVLPIRALLYTLIHNAAGLIAVQVLDGVANAIFGVVAILVVADRARGTGRFNLVLGGLATAVGVGGALSTFFGGKLIEHYGFRVSFLALGGVAAIALGLLWFGVPETLNTIQQDTDLPIPPCAQEATA